MKKMRFEPDRKQRGGSFKLSLAGEHRGGSCKLNPVVAYRDGSFETRSRGRERAAVLIVYLSVWGGRHTEPAAATFAT